MNKKLKTLLMTGLVTVLAGSSVVSSNALCKNTDDNYKTKGAIYLYINGVKHKISLEDYKSLQGKDSSKKDTNNNVKKEHSQKNNTNKKNNNKKSVSTPKSDNHVKTNDKNVKKDNNTNSVKKDNNKNNAKKDNNKNNTKKDNNTNNVKKENNTVKTPINDNNSSKNDKTDSNSFLSFQKEVVRLVNVERTKRGLSELAFNTELSSVATKKSQDMINKNYFNHTSPTYGSPFDMMRQFNINYTSAGENIAMGQKTPAEVVNAWMNSQGHRENILNKNFTDLGVGVAKSSNGTLYWTQMFIGK
ncbi:CAP domain-containing protein [Terrisporobacter sp.]